MGENWTNKKVDKFVVVNNLLGEGAFGKVYRGFFTNEDSKQVACKVIPIQAISDSAKYLDLIKREISILQKLTHNKYIVKLYDVARTNNNLYIFLEYCQDGDLKEYIKAKKNLSESESCLFFKHICEGFKDLNKKQIIHRDIKPANLLLHEGIVKISDFGFARSIENSLVPGKYTRLGSPLYMAPQILEGVNFNGKCDVWSVGIVFFEMLYGVTPWMARDQKELMKAIKTKPLQFPNSLHRSDKVKEILRGMLVVNEEDRLSWDQVFQHPLLQEAKPEPVLSSGQNNQIQQEDLELKRMNEQYLEKHLVAGYLDHNVEKVPEGKNDDQLTPSEMVGKQAQQSQINEVATNNQSQLLKYKNEKEFRKSMQKMNKFILFERNIAFFFKNTIKAIFSYFCSGKLKVELDLYNRTIFCLCKCQAINLEKVSLLVKEETSTCFSDQELWKKYKETTEFKKTCSLIEQDRAHSLKFYHELSKRTKDSLTKEAQKEASKKPAVDKFLQNLNDNFVMDTLFKETYKNTLKELIDKLTTEIKNNPDIEKENLILLKYLQVTLNPFNHFNPDTDFNQFYEEVENMPIKKLREELLAKQ